MWRTCVRACECARCMCLQVFIACVRRCVSLCGVCAVCVDARGAHTGAQPCSRATSVRQVVLTQPRTGPTLAHRIGGKATGVQSAGHPLGTCAGGRRDRLQVNEDTPPLRTACTLMCVYTEQPLEKDKRMSALSSCLPFLQQHKRVLCPRASLPSSVRPPPARSSCQSRSALLAQTPPAPPVAHMCAIPA